jgi:Fe2+ transport system protein FeoA
MDSAMKLLEVGLSPGSKVQMMRAAPFGGPMYLKAGQSYFALRKQEAENVLING